MIKVKLSEDKIEITGHANYDEYGKDIVCSGVSSIVTTTVNAILSFNDKYRSYKEEKDKFTIVINLHNDIVDKLINNMINMLKEVETNYPKNLKIRKENL